MFAGWKWVTKKNTKRKSNDKMVKQKISLYLETQNNMKCEKKTYIV